MPATLTIRDETLSGQPLHEWALEVLTEPLSVRELIRGRVYQEVQDHNHRQASEFRGLVRPADDHPLNDRQPRAFRPVDWQKQFEKAVEAFDRQQILILIDDRQAASLDDEFDVRPDTAVTFLRLTLLVGG